MLFMMADVQHLNFLWPPQYDYLQDFLKFYYKMTRTND